MPFDDLSDFLNRFFGPGMLWALLGIGGSHLVLAPSIGATFGYFGLWIATLVYAAKYGGWELGIRYAHGTGNHPVEGYRTLPGPNNWGLWLTLFIYAVGWPLILGAVGSATASFANRAGILPGPGSGNSFLILLLFALFLVLVLSSRYDLIERLFLLFLIPLAGILVLAVFVAPPSPSLVGNTLFDASALREPAFLAMFAAFAGYAPTGLSTTVTIGSWTRAKQQEQQGSSTSDPPSAGERVQALRSGRLDFHIGYLFSFLLILCMISLSASVLYPDAPSDRNLALEIARLLVPAFGEWTRIVMLVGGFAALYSTVLTVLDGSARVCTDVLKMLASEGTVPGWTRNAVLLYMFTVSAIPVLLLGSMPVTLLMWSAALMAVLQVFFFIANYYIVRTHLPDELQPGTLLRYYYLFSIVCVVLFGCIGAIGKLGGF